MANLKPGQVIYRIRHTFSSGHTDNRYMLVAGENIKCGQSRYALLIGTTSQTSFPYANEKLGCHQSREFNYTCYFIKSKSGQFPKDTYLDFTNFDNSVILECDAFDRETAQHNRSESFRFDDAETLNILNCAKNSTHLPGWVIKTIQHQIEHYNLYQSFP